MEGEFEVVGQIMEGTGMGCRDRKPRRVSIVQGGERLVFGGGIRLRFVNEQEWFTGIKGIEGMVQENPIHPLHP